MGKASGKFLPGMADFALRAEIAEAAQPVKSLRNLSLALDAHASGGEVEKSGLPFALPVVSAAEKLNGSGETARFSESFAREDRSGDTGRKKRMASRATAAVPAREPKTPKASVVKETALARRDRVVLENLPLVKAIALRVHDSLPVHVELDDLIHAGILGLFDAATKYNPGKNVAFSSYAKHRIKGAILDSLRQLDWASRDMRRRHKLFEQATRELSATLQRNPTEDEIAARMGVDVTRFRQMAIDLRNLGLISASSRPVEQEEMPAPDFPCSADSLPDSVCAKRQLRSKLDVAMEVLPERYRKVVTLYYTNEMTMKEIGGLMGINESRVSQIHKLALEKMAHALHEAGITSSNLF
jgi:RNA polymerase sigma factor for flagellar operon FliA